MADELEFSAFPQKDRVAKLAAATAAGSVVMCGWIPPTKRTEDQEAAHTRIVADMPRFGVRGAAPLKERRYALWRACQAVLGRHAPYSLQLTGSCVGSNGNNMALTSQCVEIALKGDNEEFRWLWWPFTYGCSRQRGGLRGRGEGSFGSAWAEAATTDGFFEHDPAGEPDLPDPTQRGNMRALPAAVELEWSDGAAIKANWRKLGLRHLFQTAAPIRTAADAVAALSNGYAITVASMFGFSPMVPRPVGTPPVRLVKSWNAQWAHQMWVDEYWDHPTEGEIVRWGNDWGDDAHGPPTGDEPPGGFYTPLSLLDQVLRSRDAEAYAFSRFDGFPGRELNFSAF